MLKLLHPSQRGTGTSTLPTVLLRHCGNCHFATLLNSTVTVIGPPHKELPLQYSQHPYPHNDCNPCIVPNLPNITLWFSHSHFRLLLPRPLPLPSITTTLLPLPHIPSTNVTPFDSPLAIPAHPPHPLFLLIYPHSTRWPQFFLFPPLHYLLPSSLYCLDSKRLPTFPSPSPALEAIPPPTPSSRNFRHHALHTWHTYHIHCPPPSLP